jgi:hypothetical protein
LKQKQQNLIDVKKKHEKFAGNHRNEEKLEKTDENALVKIQEWLKEKLLNEFSEFE